MALHGNLLGNAAQLESAENIVLDVQNDVEEPPRAHWRKSRLACTLALALAFAVFVKMRSISSISPATFSTHANGVDAAEAQRGSKWADQQTQMKPLGLELKPSEVGSQPERAHTTFAQGSRDDVRRDADAFEAGVLLNQTSLTAKAEAACMGKMQMFDDACARFQSLAVCHAQIVCEWETPCFAGVCVCNGKADEYDYACGELTAESTCTAQVGCSWGRPKKIAQEPYWQVAWDFLFNPTDTFGKVRSDVLASRLLGAIAATVVGYLATKLADCDGRDAPGAKNEKKIIKTHWEDLDQIDPSAKKKVDAMSDSLDIPLVLKRYRKGLLAVFVSAPVRYIAVHVLPTCVVVRILTSFESPGWFSTGFKFFLLFYYIFYSTMATLLFIATACVDRLTFVTIFVLPFSSWAKNFIKEDQGGFNGPMHLWCGAEADGPMNLVLTVMSLVLAAPQVIGIGLLFFAIKVAGKNSGLAEFTGVFGALWGAMDLVSGVLALIGLIISLCRGTASLFFLITLFTVLPPFAFAGLYAFFVWGPEGAQKILFPT